MNNAADLLRGALRDLLEQVDSLYCYELTRDLDVWEAESNWEDAIRRARAALRSTEVPKDRTAVGHDLAKQNGPA
jgi:hypothetical protein